MTRLQSESEAEAEAATFSAQGQGPTKGPGDENFPVASKLIPARFRHTILAFYRFVRLADDIADAPDLAPETKTAWLEALDTALERGRADDAAPPPPGLDAAVIACAYRTRKIFDDAGLTPLHARHLLQAFRQDATKGRYRDWNELLTYCRYSAAPVGRMLFDVHGEDKSGWPASEALCASLQILNHLQDCKSDYQELDRVYLPEPWFRDEGITVDALAAPQASAELRRVLDRTLEGVQRLNGQAQPLIGHIRHISLRIEAAIIVSIAELLAAKLGRCDPIARRVELSWFERLRAGVKGLVRGLAAR
ncbi:MAG: squalene/phytoene synthase family protein [Alphaproteobacteria bacterium]